MSAYHFEGFGNFLKNHSGNTGGYLQKFLWSIDNCLVGILFISRLKEIRHIKLGIDPTVSMVMSVQ